MRPQSAKQKGRRYQQKIRSLLIQELGIHEEDIESRSMGANGEDLILARAAREIFPYSVECKNTERPNVWAYFSQASANCGKYDPILFLSKNNAGAGLAIIDAEVFINLIRRLNECKATNKDT